MFLFILEIPQISTNPQNSLYRQTTDIYFQKICFVNKNGNNCNRIIFCVFDIRFSKDLLSLIKRNDINHNIIVMNQAGTFLIILSFSTLLIKESHQNDIKKSFTTKQKYQILQNFFKNHYLHNPFKKPQAIRYRSNSINSVMNKVEPNFGETPQTTESKDLQSWQMSPSKETSSSKTVTTSTGLLKFSYTTHHCIHYLIKINYP